VRSRGEGWENVILQMRATDESGGDPNTKEPVESWAQKEKSGKKKKNAHDVIRGSFLWFFWEKKKKVLGGRFREALEEIGRISIKRGEGVSPGVASSSSLGGGGEKRKQREMGPTVVEHSCQKKNSLVHGTSGKWVSRGSKGYTPKHFCCGREYLKGDVYKQREATLLFFKRKKAKKT